ncbi:hypothetical protein BJV77DRAFT_965297 [Russula vinacea]|nr:hypothetical protein BJV77DRAFT_965297 [Russula vinacea]
MKINELKRTSDLSKFPSLSQLLDPVRLLFDRTTVPQNPETPRGVMPVNKFTRDMHNVIPRPELPDYRFLYVSQHFNSLFIHIHPGHPHLETVAEKVSDYLVIESLHAITLGLTGIDTRAITPLLWEIKIPYSYGRRSPAAAKQERIFGNSNVRRTGSQYSTLGPRPTIPPPSRAARWNYDFNTMSGFDHLYFPMDLETHDSGAYHVARMTEPYLFLSLAVLLATVTFSDCNCNRATIPSVKGIKERPARLVPYGTSHPWHLALSLDRFMETAARDENEFF